MTNTEKILIVDDKERNLLALEQVLRDTGAEIVRATNGNDALKLTLYHEFALAILDVQMPGMDGYELAELLRSEEKTARVPIMFLSAAYSDEEHVFKGYEAGAVDFVTKPYNPRHLLSKVDVFLRLDRQRIEETESLAKFPAENPNPVLRASADGTILYANEGAQSLLDLWGRSVGQVVPVEMQQLVSEMLTSPAARHVETPCGDRVLSMTFAPFAEEGYVNIYGLDITALKRAEEALQTKNEELRGVSQQLWQAAKLATMGELAASIAHELNNPLATVSLRTESLLMQVDEDDPKHRGLSVVAGEVERMQNLVANLLQFCRSKRQQISTIDMAEDLGQTLELIEYHLRKRGIQVERDFDPDTPTVHADRQQLQQVFLNLINNAADAMDDGGTLTLRVGLCAEGRVEAKDLGSRRPPRGTEARDEGSDESAPIRYVFVEIQDTGTGIAPENLELIMQPFYTTKPEGKGTGLGLPICRRIVKEHHGHLEITSVPGRGATVRILLPANGTDSNGASEPAETMSLGG